MKHLFKFSTLILLGASAAGFLTFAESPKLDFIKIVDTPFADAASKITHGKKAAEKTALDSHSENSEVNPETTSTTLAAVKVTESSDSALFEFLKQPPSSTTLRSEVQRNLHQPPKSFINFAKKFAAPMTLAKTDGAFAMQFFSELSDCTLNNSQDAPKLVRAFCFEHAHLVSLMHPQELSVIFKSLYDKTDSDIIQLTQRSRASKMKESAANEK